MGDSTEAQGSTWEERMAQRAHARRRARGELSPSQPRDLDELTRQTRARYVAEHPGCESPEPPPPGPDDYCRECTEWAPIGNWPGVYTWRLTCGFKCGHAHHDDEVWLAGTPVAIPERAAEERQEQVPQAHSRVPK
jgi:hypothetical protein